LRLVALRLQEQKQRVAAEDVDEREREDPAERVAVVDAAECEPSPQRRPQADSFRDCSRNRKPEEREPRDAGQDVESHENRKRQKDEETRDECRRDCAARRLFSDDDRRRADVRSGQKRRERPEQDRLNLDGVPERNGIQEADRSP
jgi:hypothetical protein